MPDWVIFGTYFAFATGFGIACLRANILRLRDVAESSAQQADLHRQLAKLEVELAEVAFGEDNQDLAKARLEKADLHTKSSETLSKYADRFAHYASFPLPRSLRLRRDRPMDSGDVTP